jgi:hypothetical protein
MMEMLVFEPSALSSGAKTSLSHGGTPAVSNTLKCGAPQVPNFPNMFILFF